MNLHRFDTRAQMAEAILRMEQAGAAWHVPLLRAAMAGDLRLAFVPPGSRLPLAMLDMRRHPRPLVVVLAGDGGTGGPAGPDAFPQARRLLLWARYALLHGAGGMAWHYTLAAEAAARFRRVVVAETTGAALPAWIELKAAVAPDTPSLAIAVPPGRPAHPLCTAPAGMVVQ